MKKIFISLLAMGLVMGCGTPSAKTQPKAAQQGLSAGQCSSSNPKQEKTTKTLTHPNDTAQEQCPDNGEPKQVE